MLICIETHRTYDFPGGGGGGPLSPLDPHLHIFQGTTVGTPVYINLLNF